MGAFRDCSVCRHCHQRYAAVLLGDQEYNTLPETRLQLITQVTQCIHIHVLQGCRDELYAPDIDNLIHDIAECIFCRFGLERFILAAQFFHLGVQLFKTLEQRSRCRFDKTCCLLKLFLHPVDIGIHIGAGNRFDSSGSGSDTALGENSEA